MSLYHGFRINCTQAPGSTTKFSWDAPKRFNKRVIFFDKNKLKNIFYILCITYFSEYSKLDI